MGKEYYLTHLKACQEALDGIVQSGMDGPNTQQNCTHKGAVFVNDDGAVHQPLHRVRPACRRPIIGARHRQRDLGSPFVGRWDRRIRGPWGLWCGWLGWSGWSELPSRVYQEGCVLLVSGDRGIGLGHDIVDALPCVRTGRGPSGQNLPGL